MARDRTFAGLELGWQKKGISLVLNEVGNRKVFAGYNEVGNGKVFAGHERSWKWIDIRWP